MRYLGNRVPILYLREIELYYDSDFELKLEFHGSVEDYIYRYV